jgi:hypothetical protein
MVKLVDTLLLGSSSNASRFESEWRYLTPKGLGLPYVGFSDSRQADVNAINFWIFRNFLKVVDMDCSFPMRRYTYRLDLWFKSYEVFKISAQVGACC